MGGTNEKVLPTSGTPAATAASGSKVTQTLNISTGDIRVHENNGEVHFHNDAASLKAVVPVPLFAERYFDYIAAPSGELIFFDWSRATSVRIRCSETKQGDLFDMDATVFVKKIDTGAVTCTFSKDQSQVTLQDASGTKVVVSAMTFSDRMGDACMEVIDRATFLDSFNQTSATVVKIGPDEVSITLKKIRVTGVLKMLNDFVQGK